MKRLLFLIVASLAAAFPLPAFSQNSGLEGPFPADGYTRQKARQVKLKSVKKVRLYLHDGGQDRNVEVTNPKVIGSLVEGLKEATETQFSNQVSGVEVIDKDNNVVVYANFSLAYPSHALSPQFVKGLREAGVVMTAWEEQEKARAKTQETTRKLRNVGLVIGGALLLMLFALKRKTAKPNSRSFHTLT